MDMRHRSTPVQTCQRYAVRADRVNSAWERETRLVTACLDATRRGLGITPQIPVDNRLIHRDTRH
jgi:hypothetical protein